MIATLLKVVAFLLELYPGCFELLLFLLKFKKHLADLLFSCLALLLLLLMLIDHVLQIALHLSVSFKVLPW